MISIGVYKRSFFLFLLFLFLLGPFLGKTTAQSYGLAFSSHEAIPEQRTSLNLTNSGPICFSGQLNLEFELQFIPDKTTYFGYVFRLIDEKNQNIDLIYDQHKLNFRLINQENFTDINFEIPANVLYGSWTKIAFAIDAGKGITCTVNNKVWQTRNPGLKGTCFKAVFGASSEHNFVSSDLPPMKLRNVAIKTDDDKSYFWPLNESSGTIAAENTNHKNGKVLNPVWIEPKFNHWQLLQSLTIKEAPGLAFNNETEELYVCSADSLYTLSAKGLAFSATALSTPHHYMLPGNQCVYNQHTQTLYNFYIDQKIVSAYDFNKKSWNRDVENAPSTEHWQVNKFFSSDNQLYVLFGYGQLKYKNTIRKINPDANEWTTVQPGGDFLAPRYMAALGTTASGDTAYILGGYGSKEGDQLLNPKHFYDFLRYDVKANTVKKLYSLPEPAEQFVCANSMIIDAANNCYYALIFPNSRFNTRLQLIKGSLTDSTYTLLGQSFPYSFSDVKSFADLFYCKKNGLLLAATLFTNKELHTTELKIYSINFPPNELDSNGGGNAVAAKTTGFNHLYWIIPAGLVLLVGLYFGTRKKPKPKPIPAEAEIPLNIPVQKTEPVPIHTTSRILLFGNFEVTTAEGENITKQFTPLLKEMFLLILIHSLRNKKGVTAEKLNEILWNDKDTKDAINNRSVNLVKLKNILDKLGGSTISRKTGAWQFEYDSSSLYIDFLEYLQIVSNNTATDPLQRADQLLKIVQPGCFLQETHYEWLDNTKAEISNYVIEVLVRYSEQLQAQNEPEKILAACDAIFSFDELNEHALKLNCKSLIALGRHALANSTYTKFAQKYAEIYGEDYKVSFNALVHQ